MSGNLPKPYKEFMNSFQSLNSTKAFQPIIIRTLARSYPDFLSKGKIANKIREYYRNGDSYEQYNIWSNLSDHLGLIREQNGYYGLNIEPLRTEQVKDLIELSNQKIIQAENSDKMQFQRMSQQQSVKSLVPESNTLSENNSEMLKMNLDEDVDTIEPDEDVDTIEPDEDVDTTEPDEEYFLVRIDINQKQDQQNISQLNNYGFVLSKKEKRRLSLSLQKKITKAILFDTSGTYVRIWGHSNLKYFEHRRSNEFDLQITEFVPFNQSTEGLVNPKWLRPEMTEKSMFRKRIRKIRKIDYFEIPHSWVIQNELLKANSQTLAKEDGYNLEYNDNQLEIPNKEILSNGINKIAEELLIDKKIIEEIVVNLASGRHILLAGPIGTGKTRLARMIPEIFWKVSEKDLGYKTELYTASYEWNVTDVIGGIVPRMNDKNPTYQIQYGCVADTVIKSRNDKKLRDHSGGVYRGTWLVIDEFNRAEIDKAFGQLFTSLQSKILRIPDENTPELKTISIPKDYRIIGTLNTSDKHYLFKLSDALKRRFAYIEVKSPTKNESKKEIFYAMNNAINELSAERFSSMINLNTTKKELDDVQSNPEFVASVRSAYEILSFVRIIKDMGTAILQSIYQTMLVGTKIQGYSDDILDIALNGTIIPQLERTPATSIDIIKKFCFEDIHNFFRHIYNAPDEHARQKYATEFSHYLQYLGIDEVENLRDRFWRKNVDDDTWKMIFDKWDVLKSKNGLPRNLPLFKTSLVDLQKTFELL